MTALFHPLAHTHAMFPITAVRNIYMEAANFAPFEHLAAISCRKRSTG
jgi:hypothetical protein